MHKVLIHGPLSLYSVCFYENPDGHVTTTRNERAFSQIARPNADMRAQAPRNENRMIEALAQADADQVTKPIVEVLHPISMGFVTCCVLVGLIFGGATIWMAWHTGLALLPALAVYFAVANAVLLGAAVVLMLLCKESYDIE